MPRATLPSDYPAQPAHAAQRIVRAGFYVAFAGGILLALAFVLPDWQPSGVVPSIAQQLLQSQPAPSYPNCVDTCGRSSAGGLICLAVLYIAFVSLLAASQAFRRVPHNATSGVAALGLFLGLLPCIPAVFNLAGSSAQPADSLQWLSSGGFLFIVVGNALALVGEWWRSRS